MDGVLVLSEHARRRCQQRGVRAADLRVALRARPVYDHGDLAYRVTHRLLVRLGLDPGRSRLATMVGQALEGLVPHLQDRLHPRDWRRLGADRLRGVPGAGEPGGLRRCGSWR